MRILILLALLVAPALADVPKLERRVNDFAQVLTVGQLIQLEGKIKDIEKLPGSPQVAVILPADMGGQTIESYSHEVATTWKIGQAGKDNGVLITIAPKERKWRVEVGYGLEGAIPDSIASRIIREALDPHLKGGKTDFYGALDTAIDQIGKYIAAEAAKPATEAADQNIMVVTFAGWFTALVGVVGFVVFLAGLWTDRRDRRKRRLTQESHESFVSGGYSTSPTRVTGGAYKPKHRSKMRHAATGAAVGAAAGYATSNNRRSRSSDDDDSPSVSSSLSSGLSDFGGSSGSSFGGGGGDFGGGGASGGD